MAQDVVEVDFGQIDCGSTGSAQFNIYPQKTCYAGCTDPGQYYYWGTNPDYVTAVPSAGTDPRQKSFRGEAAGSSGSFAKYSTGPFSSTPKQVQIDHSLTFALFRGYPSTVNIVDTQTIIIRVKAVVTYKASAPIQFTRDCPLVISLKPGGPAQGKGRLPPGALPPKPGEKDYKLITDEPGYKIDDQGRVIDQPPPSYNINGNSGQWPPGTKNNTVHAPDVPGIPPWMPPGTGSIQDQDGNTWYIHSGSPGYSGGIGGGSVSVNPGSGYGRAFIYPPGKPEWGNNVSFDASTSNKVNGMPKNPTAPENVDPCFATGATDQGYTPPTPGPTDPNQPPLVVDPPGTRPDMTPPELPGPPNNGFPGGGWGNNGGGSGSTMPPPKVKSPGQVTPTPPGPGAPGPKPPEGDTNPKGEFLNQPGDGDATKYADDMARGFSSSVNKLQSSAQGFSGMLSISPLNAGVSSEWVVNFPTPVGTFPMRIPTEHAPFIRAILLLLVKACWAYGVAKLLLNG
ncbi:hypothetical protein [Luteolibacter sp. LG18]|uniref:hypothetical protein n=1 Tax=Luteolibacter sp. LG18 TaxID=2819286 RepID=UPI002B2B8E4A|nr:hypothetical protein llg_36090 [Luteolibacter sp. LG18]